MRLRSAFTLIELLTVAFIIAVMAGLILPAIGHYRAQAQVERTRNYIMAICHGLDSYKQEFGDYPPSEPERVDWTSQDVKLGALDTSTADPYDRKDNNLSGFYGSAALPLYLNGRSSYESSTEGYYLRQDTTNWEGGSNMDYLRERLWPARVTGVKAAGPKTLRKSYNPNVADQAGDRRNIQPAPRGSGGWASAGFLDSWGNVMEYFRADRDAGDRTAEVYRRAVNYKGPWPSNQGSNKYYYAFPGSGWVVDDTHDCNVDYSGAYNIQVPVAAWRDDWTDYGDGDDWYLHASPIEAGKYLIVSPGMDRKFGTPDDIGNW